MIDTHAHLDDKKFDADRAEVIRRSFDSSLEKIVTIGAGLGSSERAVDIAGKHADIFAAVGLHPEYFMRHGSWTEMHKENLVRLAEKEKVVAIGEIGLEYHSHNGMPINEKQKEFQREGFVFQLELAKRLEKPVVLHCRGERAELGEKYREKGTVYEDMAAIIGGYTGLKFVFHSFGGRLDFAQRMIAKQNVWFSFNGNITYAKPSAEILADVRAIPMERIVLEADCPYLAPMPHRGHRNKPSFVSFVCQKIAEIKGISIREADEISSQNAKKFFSLD